MDEEKRAPLLLEAIFGEARRGAETGEEWASERLLRWSRAFEDWMAEVKQTRSGAWYLYSRRAWKRLLQERHKAPWALSEEDLEEHVAWLQAQGYAPGEIRKLLAAVSNFYAWCGERGVDPACGAGFNPAAGVKRPRDVCYWGADGSPGRVLSREEVAALLGVLRLDETPLGKREYAYCVARLNVGVTVEELNRLQWGQILDGGRRTEDECRSSFVDRHSSVLVRWRAGSEAVAFPEEAWGAVWEYLEASGRLAGMQAESYIFAPLKEVASFPGEGGQAGDWREGKPLSNQARYHSMKVYGRAAGIEAGKLTAGALRRTAIRLKMETFPDGFENHLGEMQAFLGCESERGVVKFRLRTLAGLPPDTGRRMEEAELRRRAPVRETGQPTPGAKRKHGMYGPGQPPEPVEAILAEKIQGMEAELAGLRALGEGLLARLEQAQGQAGQIHLLEAYTVNAARLADLVKGEKARQKKGRGEGEWIAEIEKTFRNLGYTGEWPPPMDSPWWGDTPLPAGGGLKREIAAVRFVLRSLLQYTHKAADTAEYVRLAGLYGEMCWRLGKLLRLDAPQAEFVERFNLAVERMLAEVVKELRGDTGPLTAETQRAITASR